MAKTEQVNVRMDPKVKAEAEAVFAQLGMTPSQAIMMFYRQVSLQQGLPFAVRIPNAETLEAMRELDEGQALRRYESFDAYRTDLGV
ncbi:MAG: type II toxin-antitoxin system RelB/DinJ family antitoxin [Candidatus Tectomicrobia bacterium]|nr:type II toxin-antitoxin system RelB/DinJ family antitoxin [Candidatus Tectomicrobia bacterium]